MAPPSWISPMTLAISSMVFWLWAMLAAALPKSAIFSSSR